MMDLRTAALLLGGVLVLLLFGCIGGPAQPAAPTQQAGGTMGDADISPSAGDDEALLPDEGLIPPAADGGSDALPMLDDSDISIDEAEDELSIAEEDIIEPA